MPIVTGFVVVFGLLILWLFIQAKRAGPLTLSDMDLRRAVSIKRADVNNPGDGWSHLGSLTTADGLNLRFDHDDDPKAEASFVIEDRKLVSSLGQRITVRLTDTFETHHVHTRGDVFRVRLRGTGPVIGREVRIQMHVFGDGKPRCGRVENDDDTDAAVGGWIEFEEIEVLQVGRS